MHYPSRCVHSFIRCALWSFIWRGPAFPHWTVWGRIPQQTFQLISFSKRNIIRVISHSSEFFKSNAPAAGEITRPTPAILNFLKNVNTPFDSSLKALQVCFWALSGLMKESSANSRKLTRGRWRLFRPIVFHPILRPNGWLDRIALKTYSIEHSKSYLTV